VGPGPAETSGAVGPAWHGTGIESGRSPAAYARTHMDTHSEATGAGARRGPPSAQGQLAGKYMIFKLAREEYGLAILEVREIIRLMEITVAPGMPEHIRGVINLRGRVVPVIDLRLKLGMGRAETSDQAVIIVVQFACGGRTLTMGVLVDEVLEVLSIEGAHIEPPPPVGSSAEDLEFILGIGKVEKRVIFLLDVGRLLSPAEADGVAGASGD
jgi:purine-binding chemotaxis protein CheW